MPEIYNTEVEMKKTKKPIKVDKMGVHITDLDSKQEKEKPEAWREQE
jgi:hypothetical protein